MDVGSDNDDYEVVEEIDYDDPRFAPLDPNDRLANARNRPDWDAPAPTRQRRMRRPASAEEVRRQQFETARRIIFGRTNVHGYVHYGEHYMEPWPGKQPRERWTTAGTVEPLEVEYQTPFSLGGCTLMITQGAPDGHVFGRGGEAKGRFGAAVWMQMTGTVWDRGEIVKPTSPPKRDAGLMLAANWVFIGILRADCFIPASPNWMDLVTIKAYGHAGEADVGPNNYVNYRTHVDISRPVVLGRSLFVAQEHLPEKIVIATAGFRPLHGRLDIRGLWYWNYDTNLSWVQAAPKVKDDDPEEISLLDVANFAGWSTNGRNGSWDQVLEHDAPGFLRMSPIVRNMGRSPSTVYDTTMAAKYFGAVPLDRTRRYFDVQPPAEFLRHLGCAGAVPHAACLFRYGGPHRLGAYNESVWRVDDMAAVCYAQSYIMHVLTGPDRRHWFPNAADQRPMKEMQEPLPCMAIRLLPQTDEVYRLELTDGQHFVPFESLKTALYFQVSSLAYRAARVLDTQLAREAGQMSSKDFAHYVQGLVRDTDLLEVMRLIQERKDRMEEYEFMGCHVCLDKPSTLKANKVPGLQVCSALCYQQYKVGAKINKAK